MLRLLALEKLSLCAPPAGPGLHPDPMLSVPNLDLVPGLGFLIPASLTAPACDAQD